MSVRPPAAQQQQQVEQMYESTELVLPPKEENFYSWNFGERLDYLSKAIMTRGFQRPFFMLFWHFCIWLLNYGAFALIAVRFTAVAHWPTHGSSDYFQLARHLFAKFMVWQHFAEAVGCRQGPLGGRFGLPNNWRFRLSTGTLKLPFLPIFGSKRNYLDLIVHTGFFVCCLVFVFSIDYQYLAIRLICALDLWILCSDLSQFYASTGHGYWTMLLSLCFEPADGQLAGVQIALIFQWFFSGIGKVGPWFNYVNGPFMLQSGLLRGQKWLFKLLVKSQDELSPTMLGICVAQFAAAVEWVAPLFIMVPNYWVILLGIIGISAMHFYILVMPAPFDVYSWNTCYFCAAIYLFYLNASNATPEGWSQEQNSSFGFDWQGAKQMNPILAFALFCEFAVCWYGQFFPNQVGYYFSHRYWAGNWVQGFYMVRRTQACADKIAKVKAFDPNPLAILKAEPSFRFLVDFALTSAMAYLWVATFNVKCVVRMVEAAMKLSGDTNFDNWQLVYSLPSYCSGEFRDQLYSKDMIPIMQENMGFDPGECIMIALGSFGCCRQSAFYKITDLGKGVIAEGKLSREGMTSMDAYATQSLDISLPLAPGLEDDLTKPLLGG